MGTTIGTQLFLSVLVLSLLVCLGESFSKQRVLAIPLATTRSPGHLFRCVVGPLAARADAHEDDQEATTGIPQLPAFGTSSFSESSTELASGQETPPDLENTALVSPKFKLQYTCNVCETRNSHMVSRMAYREGVVIAICKGCKSKHLIADNLDGNAGLEGNIEDYFKAKGMEDSVHRVNQEVFDLENMLRFDSTGGALVGEDGNPVLE